MPRLSKPARRPAERRVRLAPSKTKTAARAKWVYRFDEGNATMKALLGGKGANLAEMTKLGLPVPPGFIVTTAGVQRARSSGGRFPDGLWAQVLDGARASSSRPPASASATPATRCSCPAAPARSSRCRA